ncbi:MAG: hypothetical protein AAFV32_01655 [Myxococcota bacterium]
MSCERVKKRLKSGQPLTEDESAHVAECELCDALVDSSEWLEAGEPPSAAFDADAVFAQTQEQIGQERGVRARLRAWSTRRRFLLVATLMLGSLTAIGIFSRRPMDPMYSLERWWLLLTVFVLTGLTLAYHALRGPDRSPRPWLVLALMLGVAAMIEPALPELDSIHILAPEMFFAQATKCLIYGVINGIPVAALVALIDRRDRSLPGRLWLAGGAGGATGLAALALHCPYHGRSHLMVSHVTAAVVLTVGTMALLGWLQSRKRSRV